MANDNELVGCIGLIGFMVCRGKTECEGAVAQNPFRSLKRIFDRGPLASKPFHLSSNAGFVAVSFHWEWLPKIL